MVWTFEWGCSRRSVRSPVRLSQHAAGFARITESGIDHVCVDDHVSFHVGAGSDALINATSVLTHYSELPCYVALYLLPLRHPGAGSTTARQRRRACTGEADARRGDRW